METVLGRGYSINEDFGLTDFYSPPSSIVDVEEEPDDDLFYPEDENYEVQAIKDETLSTSSIGEIKDPNLKDWLKPSPLKFMGIEATPPPTPLLPRRHLDPLNSTTTAFKNMTINTSLLVTPAKSMDLAMPTWSLNMPSINSLLPISKVSTLNQTNNLLTPANLDRRSIEHRHSSDPVHKSIAGLGTTSNSHQSISVQHTEINNETSRLFSYMDHVDGCSSNLRTICATSSNSWSTSDDPLSIPSQMRINNNSCASPLNVKSSTCLNNPILPQRVNSLFPNTNGSLSHTSSFQHRQHLSQDPWFLSEMSTFVQQNNQNTNILLSTTAQQILAANAPNNNNRPLRSEKIDIEVIKHLIREASWKRQCGLKKEVCVFCRNNGENELIYSSHSLKDSIGNVTCPILRAYQCPICGATGSQAHTIKYCQATGDDNNRHIPTPYEKMLRMQTIGLDDNIPSSMPGLFSHVGSPSSLYTNGWSDSYL